MTVLAVVGILAAAAIPVYYGYIARAQVAEALAFAGNAKTQVAEFWTYRHSFPADNRAAGMAAPVDLNGAYVQSTTIRNGSIEIKMKSAGVANGVAGETVTLTPLPAASDDPLTWLCSSSASARYLPQACRP